MPSLRPRFAPLLLALSAAAPTFARADDAQPAAPPAGPSEPSRPWIDEGEAPRPSTEGAKPAPPDRPATSKPSADEGEPASGDGARPAARRGPARPPAGARKTPRAPADEDEAIGFSPTEGEGRRRPATTNEAGRFGHKGQFVLDELVGFHWGSPAGVLVSETGAGISVGYMTGLFMVSTSTSDYSGYKIRANTMSVRPSVDVFIADGISVGGSLAASYSDFKRDSPVAEGGGAEVPTKSSFTTFGIEPRVGSRLRLTEGLSLWTRIGLGYRASWAGDSGVNGLRADAFSAFARPGLVAELGRHAFLDAGPELRIIHSRLDPASGLHGQETALAVGVNAALGLVF
jgi:hypothetical protein